MGKIVDLSHHQPSNKINWSLAAKDIDLAIIRVQYGSKTEDKEHKNHVANCKKYNIPFGHYAYGCFVSINDAIAEANDFLKRMDKDAKFLVLDVEGDTVKACGTKNLAQASQAFIDTCKKAGYKVGFYTSHELYKQYGLDKMKADFLWLPRYGKDNGTPNLKPAYPCDLWQYSQKCKVSWYDGLVDLNLLNGSKTLEWFTGKQAQTANTAVTQNNVKNGGTRMYQPSNNELREATLRVLGRLSKKDPNGISKDWYTKAQKGEIPLDDVVGLLYVALDRGLIQGSNK
ncbi:GH25 family lysozyme [Bacillus smithii]|uniref:GH25 family lysozyme n=1 Tax=Bacillus smithii TaxID=1479 RepID=UPI002E243AA7|nr:GH25 family lysozyme [Bacillus smithii]MED4926635.1 GH25 family lysozyme [Bacillus smithii]